MFLRSKRLRIKTLRDFVFIEKSSFDGILRFGSSDFHLGYVLDNGKYSIELIKLSSNGTKQQLQLLIELTYDKLNEYIWYCK